MHQNIAIMIANNLPLIPLPHRILHIDPGPHLKPPILKAEGLRSKILCTLIYRVDQLVDRVLILLEHLQRLRLINPETIHPTLEISVALVEVVAATELFDASSLAVV